MSFTVSGGVSSLQMSYINELELKENILPPGEGAQIQIPEREDFTSILEVQRACNFHGSTVLDVMKIIKEIEPKINDIHHIISQYRADTAMLFVKHSQKNQDAHTFIEQLPKNQDIEKADIETDNVHLKSLKDSVMTYLDSIWKALQSFQKSFEKISNDENTVQSFDKDDICHESV